MPMDRTYLISAMLMLAGSMIRESEAITVSQESGWLRRNGMQSAMQSAWAPFAQNVTIVETEEAIEAEKAEAKASEEPGFIIIVSAQRSASTSLAQALSKENTCVYNCNEFFGRGTSRQCEPYKHFSLKPLMRIQQAREELCELGIYADFNNPAKPDSARETCRHRCVVAAKLFPNQGVKGQDLEDLLLHPQARVVVLERNPNDRWCSLQHAEDTGDWVTIPTHWENSTGVRPECIDEAPADVLQQHLDWYEGVRGILSRHSKPRVEIPFEAFVGSIPAVMSQISEHLTA